MKEAMKNQGSGTSQKSINRICYSFGFTSSLIKIFHKNMKGYWRAGKVYWRAMSIFQPNKTRKRLWMGWCFIKHSHVHLVDVTNVLNRLHQAFWQALRWQKCFHGFLCIWNIHNLKQKSMVASIELAVVWMFPCSQFSSLNGLLGF